MGKGGCHVCGQGGCYGPIGGEVVTVVGWGVCHGHGVERLSCSWDSEVVMVMG